MQLPIHILEQVCEYAVFQETLTYPDRFPTALCMAVSYGSVELVEHLIRNGCDVNHVCHPMSNPLIWALVKNNISVFKALVKAGANIHYIRPEFPTSILNLAVANSSAEMVQVVLDLGGSRDINYVSLKGSTPLSICMELKCPAKLKVLFQAGANPFQKSADNTTILDQEFSDGKMGALLRNGAIRQQVLALCAGSRLKHLPISRLPRELLRYKASFLLN